MTYPDWFALNDDREVGDGHMEHARDGDTEELVTVLGLDDTLPPQRLALVVRNKPGLRALKSMIKKIQTRKMETSLPLLETYLGQCSVSSSRS